MYAAFCVTAVSVLTGSGSSQSGNPHKATAGVLGWPAGPGLVAAAGGVFLGVALYQGYKGITKKFLEDSKTEQMSPVDGERSPLSELSATSLEWSCSDWPAISW